MSVLIILFVIFGGFNSSGFIQFANSLSSLESDISVGVIRKYTFNDGYKKITDLEHMNTELNKLLERTIQLDKNSSASDIISSCMAFINLFSETASNFTECSIKNARPVRFCEQCVGHFNISMSVYEVIIQGVATYHGLPCGQVVKDTDKMQVILKTANFINQIWNDGNCNNCFENGTIVSETPLYRLNNDTMRLNDYLKDTLTCFHNNSRTPISPYPIPNSTTNETITVCNSCRKYYDQANNLYIHLEHAYHHKVCMDLVDSINYTRHLWSQVFNCSKPQEDVMAVMILSGLFCSTPVVFYIAAKIYGARMEHKILEQKRLHTQNDSNEEENREDTTE